MKPVNVYMADLRYNYSGVLSTDCMPLSVAYLKAVMDRDLPEVRTRLFAYPGKLLSAMQAEPPDVLMVSNYVWNENLSLRFAAIARQLNPNVLTVMGGPNISLEPDRQLAYFKNHPEIDLFILGEADFLACEVVKNLVDCGLSVSKLGEREIPSSLYRRPDGTIHRTLPWERHKQVDEIPSPWLTGIQDEFFDGKLAPMIETNRGCPFTCTFCVQGTRWYTKVHYFSKERIFEELEYIARRIKSQSPAMGTLRIADSNYGMFERDVEISGHIGKMQKEYGWPTFIDATTGKNRPERIIKSVEQVSGALVLYQAVQSLNEETLKKVKRDTIKLEAYEQIQIHIRGRGLRSNSDLILGLPGETLETHLDAVRKLIDTGINEIHNFQAMMLKGSELESEESRKMFQFDTRFRVLPKNFGVYGERPVMDIEEIVVATDTLPFDDYVRARKYALASSAFWNDGWFEDGVKFAQKFGVKRSQCWSAMLPAMEQETGVVHEFLNDFVCETVGELFPTRAACIDFYSDPENFRKLTNGDIGDNLMYKYRARASFFIWKEICRVGMAALKDLIVSSGSSLPEDFDEFWADFVKYGEMKHAHGTTIEEVLSPVTGEFQYDMAAWRDADMPLDFSGFRVAGLVPLEFSLSPEHAREMEAALAVWTTSLKGLTKLVTRIQLVWQVRACRALTVAYAAAGRRR